MTDAGLAHLAGVTSLVALRLRNPAISDVGLASLADLSHLTELSIEGPAAVTDEGLKVLANYLELTSLRVSHCQGVSDRGLAPLANMPKLRLLFLRGTPITGACLGCFQEGAGLQRIDLAETRVSDDDLQHLRGMKNLQWLSFRKTRVTDAGMRYLADLPKLTYLQLAETAVGDAGLAEIAKIESLEELDLELLRISDKGLAQLTNLKNLKRLNLAMVVVPDEAVTALQAAIPGLTSSGGGFQADGGELARRASARHFAQDIFDYIRRTADPSASRSVARSARAGKLWKWAEKMRSTGIRIGPPGSARCTTQFAWRRTEVEPLPSCVRENDRYARTAWGLHHSVSTPRGPQLAEKKVLLPQRQSISPSCQSPSHLPREYAARQEDGISLLRHSP